MVTSDAMTGLELARRVLQTEAAAIVGLVDRLDERFERAVALVQECRGRAILTGMGKSGIICRKIAATLASTGTSAFFLHPAEAIHGDLGVLQAEDVVVMVSYSGETAELVRLVELIRRIGARIVAITGCPSSTLAQASDIALDCQVSEEACPLNLAPTASTTAALALGDALAMAISVRKGFREEDFAHLHPGGKLGRRLLRIDHVMHRGDEVPLVHPDQSLREAVVEISRKGLGMTCVGEDGRLAGVITDGDLRRHMAADRFLERPARAVMSADPATVAPTMLAVEALALMERRKITSLVVVTGDRRIEGVVHLHDLWRTGMF